MAQSFVPEDTNVVCTMMTVPSPQQVKITQASNVLFKSKEKPLLTAWDNKISCSFACKSPASFWGGLQALAAGIAIGAAVVLTGGAALVVVGVACAVSVAAGCTALYKMAHDCDATLNIKWEKPHDKVKFNSEKALLNRSILQCPKGGGTLTIIMSPAIAKEAAEYICSNNTKEVFAKMGSQFAIGFITSFTGGMTTVATAVSGLVTVGMYFASDFIEEKKLLSDNTSNVATNVVGTFAAGIIEDNIVANATQIKQVAVGTKFYAEGLVKNNPIYKGIGGGLAIKGFEEAQRQSVKKSVTQTASKLLAEPGRLKETTKLVGEGIIEGNPIKAGFGKYFTMKNLSLAGLVANIGIGYFANDYMDDLAENTVKMRKEFDKQDMNNGISIIAKEV